MAEDHEYDARRGHCLQSKVKTSAVHKSVRLGSFPQQKIRGQTDRKKC